MSVLESIEKILDFGADFISSTTRPSEDYFFISRYELKSKIDLFQAQVKNKKFPGPIDYDNLLLIIQKKCKDAKTIQTEWFFQQKLVYFLIPFYPPKEEYKAIFMNEMDLLLKSEYFKNNAFSLFIYILNQLNKFFPNDLFTKIVLMTDIKNHISILKNMKTTDIGAFNTYIDIITPHFIEFIHRKEYGEKFGESFLDFLLKNTKFENSDEQQRDQMKEKLNKLYDIILNNMMETAQPNFQVLKQILLLAIAVCSNTDININKKLYYTMIDGLKSTFYDQTILIIKKYFENGKNVQDILLIADSLDYTNKGVPLETLCELRDYILDSHKIQNEIASFYTIVNMKAPEILITDKVINIGIYKRQQLMKNMIVYGKWDDLCYILREIYKNPKLLNSDESLFIAEYACELISHSNSAKDAIYQFSNQNIVFHIKTINSMAESIVRYYTTPSFFNLLSFFFHLYHEIEKHPLSDSELQKYYNSIQFYHIDALCYLLIFDSNQYITSMALNIMQLTLKLYIQAHKDSKEKEDISSLPCYGIIQLHLKHIAHTQRLKFNADHILKSFETNNITPTPKLMNQNHPNELSKEYKETTIYQNEEYIILLLNVTGFNKTTFAHEIFLIQYINNTIFKSIIDKQMSHIDYSNLPPSKFLLLFSTKFNEMEQNESKISFTKLTKTKKIAIASVSIENKIKMINIIEKRCENTKDKIQLLSLTLQNIYNHKNDNQNVIHFCFEALMKYYSLFTNIFVAIDNFNKNKLTHDENDLIKNPDSYSMLIIYGYSLYQCIKMTKTTKENDTLLKILEFLRTTAIRSIIEFNTKVSKLMASTSIQHIEENPNESHKKPDIPMKSVIVTKFDQILSLCIRIYSSIFIITQFKSNTMIPNMHRLAQFTQYQSIERTITDTNRQFIFFARKSLLQDLISTISLTSMHNILFYSYYALQFYETIKNSKKVNPFMIFVSGIISESSNYQIQNDSFNFHSAMLAIDWKQELSPKVKVPSDQIESQTNNLNHYYSILLHDKAQDFINSCFSILKQTDDQDLIRTIFQTLKEWLPKVNIQTKTQFFKVFTNIISKDYTPLIRSQFLSMYINQEQIYYALILAYQNDVFDQFTWKCFLDIDKKVTILFIFGMINNITDTYLKTHEKSLRNSILCKLKIMSNTVPLIIEESLKDKSLLPILAIFSIFMFKKLNNFKEMAQINDDSILLLLSFYQDILLKVYKIIISDNAQVCDISLQTDNPIFNNERLDINKYETFFFMENMQKNIIEHAFSEIILYIYSDDSIEAFYKYASDALSSSDIEEIYKGLAFNFLFHSHNNDISKIEKSCELFVNIIKRSGTIGKNTFLKFAKVIMSSDCEYCIKLIFDQLVSSFHDGDDLNQQIVSKISSGLLTIEEVEKYISPTDPTLMFWTTDDRGSLSLDDFICALTYGNSNIIYQLTRKVSYIPKEMIQAAIPLIFSPTLIDFATIYPFVASINPEFLNINDCSFDYNPTIPSKGLNILDDELILMLLRSFK